MKAELCSFSGYKIYPGHRQDRREEENTKKNSSKKFKTKELAEQSNSSVPSLVYPLLIIMAKRNQKPEVREAQREQAIRAAKKAKKAKKTAMAAAKAPTKAAPKQNIVKPMKVSAHRVGGKH
ncbi:60S ribosomal protein L24 [Cricetulus griseus]|uniref:60S ribosomal protein L24 n=1 Tax=Cricetulus griseus TaxID=10029 RepID=G3H9E6_CRIGR|nr:60S ribosomal protein L24 [Cricetulus griseus]ERE67341.1 60S ribosomal protein L24-like protein [Cricetulus griseus]